MKLLQICSCIAIVASVMWSNFSHAGEIDDLGCTVFKINSEDCLWATRIDQKDMYHDAMRQAYARLNNRMHELSHEDKQLANYYDSIAVNIEQLQNSWEVYNASECGVGGALAFGAWDAAFDCESDGYLQRFLELHQVFMCINDTTADIDARTEIVYKCVLPLLKFNRGRFQ